MRFFSHSPRILLLIYSATSFVGARRHSSQLWYPYGFYHTDADLQAEKNDDDGITNEEEKIGKGKNVKNVVHKRKSSSIIVPFVGDVGDASLYSHQRSFFTNTLEDEDEVTAYETMKYTLE